MATFLERFRRDPARVRLDRLERLQALTEELSAAQTREEIVRVVLEHGPRVAEARGGALFQECAPGELELVHAIGIAEGSAERWGRVHADDAHPVAEAYRTGRPLWVATRAELVARFPELAGSADTGAEQSWAALPLAIGGTRGVAALSFGERRAFDDEERNFVGAVVRQCANAAERARLFDASNRLAERLRQLQSVATLLSGATTARDVAAGAFRALGTLAACAVEIHGLAPGDRVALLARHGRGSEAPAASVAVDAPTPAAEVVRTGRAIWLESPDEIARRYPHLEGSRAAREERAWAVVPLLASGRALGALVAAFREPRRLEPDDRTYVRLVAQPCAQALDRARPSHGALPERAEADAGAALLAATCGAAPVAIALLDREMRFLRVNDAFALEDGISADAHLGRSPLDLFQGVPPDLLLGGFHEVLATGRSADRDLEAEVPSRPGVRSRFAASLFPVRVHGEIAGVGLLIRRR